MIRNLIQTGFAISGKFRAFSGEVDTGSREENASKQGYRASLLITSEAKRLYYRKRLIQSLTCGPLTHPTAPARLLSTSDDREAIVTAHRQASAISLQPIVNRDGCVLFQISRRAQPFRRQ
ncbi:hypothetical protein [Nitrobacter winogradskyi]|uniref:hypothetical protein n=1 Tax=Nitrobacter winogradskyi TaxID=913 RepID=UPI00164F3ECF|nr:hypothetical protein [Nitrobacter winogradskyi]